MPHPTGGYRLPDGSRASSVTTIIHANLGWGQDGLMNWAQWLGGQGLAWRSRRDFAGVVGSAFHEHVERFLQGLPPRFGVRAAAVERQSSACYSAFLGWVRSVPAIHPVALELQGVDIDLRVGWCLDALLAFGSADGLAVLVDWKSSSRLRGSHVIQTAAYRKLLERRYPEFSARTGPGALLLNATKRGEWRAYPVTPEQIDFGWEAFLALHRLHQLRHLLDPDADYSAEILAAETMEDDAEPDI